MQWGRCGVLCVGMRAVTGAALVWPDMLFLGAWAARGQLVCAAVRE